MATARLVGEMTFLAALAATLGACGGGGGGGGSTPTSGSSGANWTIPETAVIDAGPGRDGIPSIDRPVMQLAADVPDREILPNELIVGVLHEGTIHAYSHNILNWHEVVNDSIDFNDFIVSYCPLTGSAMSWDADDSLTNTEFGVSGLLYNSNLILYDRNSGSRWSQMLQQSVQGSRVREQPARIQVVETRWSTWQAMYPDSFVLTRVTSYSRDYDAYPYANYRANEELLFPVERQDNRLHPKTRIIGIHGSTASKVYQVSGFGSTTQAINDQFDGQPIVAAGNSRSDIAVIFGRELADGTILTFTALDDQLPNILQDTEGNTWDVFGNAVSGPRAGERLPMTNSFTAFWFAWAAFFDSPEIHFN